MASPKPPNFLKFWDVVFYVELVKLKPSYSNVARRLIMTGSGLKMVIITSKLWYTLYIFETSEARRFKFGTQTVQTCAVDRHVSVSRMHILHCVMRRSGCCNQSKGKSISKSIAA